MGVFIPTVTELPDVLRNPPQVVLATTSFIHENRLVIFQKFFSV
jgi:hypothetical protein